MNSPGVGACSSCSKAGVGSSANAVAEEHTRITTSIEDLRIDYLLVFAAKKTASHPSANRNEKTTPSPKACPS